MSPASEQGGRVAGGAAAVADLARAGIRSGKRGRFLNNVDLVNKLDAEARAERQGRTADLISRLDFLILDELGYLPIDKRGADLMFQVVAARYECGSIVITTNRIFREWGKIFDVDNTLATAIIDRLMHHGEALVIQGESYRTRDKDDK